MMHLTSLRQLDLSGRNISDNGLQYLIKLSSLQKLNLKQSQEITDNGLKYLMKLPSLQKVDLSKCYQIDGAYRTILYCPITISSSYRDDAYDLRIVFFTH